jgi:hypothetical protein
MGEYDYRKKNVAGWVTSNCYMPHPALKGVQGGVLMGENAKRQYERDVIRYAWDELKFLLPSQYKTFSLPEFAGIIENHFDLNDIRNSEIAEAVELMKKYPLAYVNYRRDNSELGKLRDPHITAMIGRFEKEKVYKKRDDIGNNKKLFDKTVIQSAQLK